MIAIAPEVIEQVLFLAGIAIGVLAVVSVVLLVTGVKALLARRRWDRVHREQERALRRRRYHLS
jgi:hypothetical protein